MVKPSDGAIAQAIDENPLLGVLREAADETERRVPATRTLPLYEYTPTDRDSNQPLVAPGTVTLFLAQPGSELLDQVRECIRRGVPDGEDLELAKRLHAIATGREVMPMQAAVDLLLGQEVIAELTYDGSPLVSNAFVPDDLELAVFPLPYTGGAIAADAFRLVHQTRSGDGWLDGFLAVHRPNLTAAEEAALSAIPRSSSGMNIGKAAMCYAITGVTIVAVVIFATTACPGAFSEPHLDEEKIKKINPEETARQLLALRRRALERR